MDVFSMLMPLFPFLFFFGLIFFLGRGKTCPSCHKPMPLFQSPLTKSRRQWLVGGYRCPNCGCETDLKGRQVATSAVPDRGALKLGLGMFVVCIVISLLLTSMLVLILLTRA
ncbi:hypothetical protein [Gimesia panareensis]|uniref:hypothetical protein n=1 Tax=Gimesia panareensis TaxID=2527978 RepID=UPI00118C4A0C|nr:hypothetical protein [Gimesia panareensis]QDU50906.1 hypothetical protein Pan110_32670 [Gimesia panareensis]